MFSFGVFNPELTVSIRSLALSDSSVVRFTRHAETEMDNDGFDHADVLRCLQKGNVFGPAVETPVTTTDGFDVINFEAY